jgi:oligopeptidase B
MTGDEETMTECRTRPVPPRAPKTPHLTTIHGDEREDDYFWMRDLGNPEVMRYIKAENAYTEEIMGETGDFQEKLYREMVERIKETDSSVPVKYRDYFYYHRTEKDRQYKIHCRKKGSTDAEEEITLDVNALAEGHSFCDIGAYEPSPDNQLLLYAADMTGSEIYTLYVKDLNTGRIVDEIKETSGDCLWANDRQTIFYTRLDKARRPYKVFRHKLGSNFNDDIMVFHEPDNAFSLWLSINRSRRFIMMTLKSNNTSEVRYLSADNPGGPFLLFAPRRHKVEYYVEHQEDKFVILTNEKAINFRVMETEIAKPSRRSWKELIPHSDQVLIEDFDAFINHLVIYEREKGLKKIRIIDRKKGKEHHVRFPEAAFNIWPEGNREYDTGTLRFCYESLITPRSVYDYDMETKTQIVKKVDEVKGYDRSRYATERIFASSLDGTMVPLSLAYRKDLKSRQGNPLYLLGYGAYGISYDPMFSSNRLSLLDRGFVFAIAHIRGGKELGRAWYLKGKLLKKKNTFGDFIACAEHLISKKYTSPDRLVISGRSAGGLLMGAVTNMKPQLFTAVIAYVPFVDALNTMLDPSIPLTVPEYEEWGNPNNKSYYYYIRSYSPYDNVKPRHYPSMLIIGSLNDSRVQFWEPLKWAARLRDRKTGDNLLLLKTNLDAGHSGASGRYDFLREIALEYAFIFKVQGIGA